jgi:hypothetical protein
MIAGPRAADMELRLNFKIRIYSQLGRKGKADLTGRDELPLIRRISVVKGEKCVECG